MVQDYTIWPIFWTAADAPQPRLAGDVVPGGHRQPPGSRIPVSPGPQAVSRTSYRQPPCHREGLVGSSWLAWAALMLLRRFIRRATARWPGSRSARLASTADRIRW